MTDNEAILMIRKLWHPETLRRRCEFIGLKENVTYRWGGWFLRYRMLYPDNSLYHEYGITDDDLEEFARWREEKLKTIQHWTCCNPKLKES